jgi:hypothetical protein
VTKRQILSAIRAAARKLGRAPTSAELFHHKGVRSADIRRHFPGLHDAIREAGLIPRFRGARTETASLLCDWARVARRVKRLPTGADYQREGRHSATTLQRRCKSWQAIPERFRAHVRRWQKEAEWGDVLEIIGRSMQEPETVMPLNRELRSDRRRPAFPPKLLFRDRPVLGAFLYPQHHVVPGLLYEPTNEAGVMFVFAALAHRLGFEIEMLQQQFPDCEARREIRPGKWQRVRIELEFESRSFLLHGHDPKRCDIILCWRHNWKGCPKHIEVIELGKIVRRGGFN